jgi:hypothetical protein
MSYPYSEEVEAKIGEHEITITISTDVVCTFGGAPATPPSYSSGGEPAEAPEFEADPAWIEIFGHKGTITLNASALNALFGEKFMDEFYERAEEEASKNYDPSDDEPDYEDDYDLD